MTTLQLAIAAGLLVGLGLTIVIWRLAPAQPHLSDALERLAPRQTTAATAVASQSNGSAQDRLGLLLQRRVPAIALLRIPTKELALLRIPVHRFIGDKALFALVGLLIPPAITVLATLVGTSIPFALPVVASLGLAVAMSFLPDYNARDDARAARIEFARALGAYMDGVSTERLGGTGTTQSLTEPANAADSWVFVRIREELARAELNHQRPWDGLNQLSVELGLPELGDLADIMRLAGENGASVAESLGARASSLRNALLIEEQTKANAAGERMTIPVSVLAMVFLVMLAVPAGLSVLNV